MGKHRSEKWYMMSKQDDSQGQVADEGTGRTVAVSYDAKDANLIAAAPELLEALKRAAPWLGKMIADGAHKNSVLSRDCEVTLKLVEAAIAKAEGRE
jgi:hypothetical protein